VIEFDIAVMNQFYMKVGITEKDITNESGIHDLISGSVIDATQFNPCEYLIKLDKTYSCHSRNRFFLCLL
jgi:S-adenosylmethionine decarboxylase